MIDVHSHLLYGVDDGAKNRKESIQMLKEAKTQGIEAIILTPHYRKGMFKHPNDKIWENFMDLKEVAKEIGIDIYLGTEFHVNSSVVEYLQRGRCRTLADTEYMLAEYGYDTEFTYIKSTIQELLLNGYIPIIAHAERYACLREQIECVELLRDIGAMIQVNADAILGIDGFLTKNIVRKFLKNRLVDFVASDSHGIMKRTNNLGKCRDYLYKKYDGDYIDKILEINARNLIGSGKR